MADIHALEGNGERWKLVMHFPVPDTNNDVGVNHRTALASSGIGGSTILAEGTGPGQITTAEKAMVESGEVAEHVVGFRMESGGTTTGELRASIRQFYQSEKTIVLEQLQAQLRYFGHTEAGA